MYFSFGIILLYALTSDTTKGLIRDSVDVTFDEQFNDHTLNKGVGLTSAVEKAFYDAVEITN